MYRVSNITVVGKYKLHVTFEDGIEGDIDLSPRLFGPMFEPLKDENIFAKVSIDEFGAITWPNGADLAPDALHRILKDNSRATLTK